MGTLNSLKLQLSLFRLDARCHLLDATVPAAEPLSARRRARETAHAAGARARLHRYGRHTESEGVLQTDSD